MKLLLAFATASLLGATAAQAQTVLPSGAVAPTGAVAPSGQVITPGTVPGSQPLSTPDAQDGGSPRASRRARKVPGLDRQERRQNRKMDRMHYTADAEKQAGKK